MMAAAPARLFQLVAGNAGLVTVLAAGALLFALFPVTWHAVAHRMAQRRWKRRHPATKPNRVIDDALPLFFDRRPEPEALERLAAVREFDDDTFQADGLVEALDKMLRGDGRG